MLGSKQTKLSFHSELFELIPENHLLKKINKNIDFSFVNALLKDSYCEYYGRPAKEPELLFRLLFLQTLYSLSDVRVIEESQVNLAYKWFLGLNPEDALPDPSLLAKFRKHRLGANALEAVLYEVVKQAIDKGLIKSKSLLVDATHSHANAKKDTPLGVLQKAAKKVRKVVYEKRPEIKEHLPEKPKLSKSSPDAAKEQLHYLAKLGEAVEKRVNPEDTKIINELKNAKQIVEDERLLAFKGIQSAVDPDARIGWKTSTRSFFGYKTHLGMSEERIITAVEVTSGEKSDGKYLKPLIEKSQLNGFEIDEVLADTAYSGKENLQYMHERDITPTIPLNPVVFNEREDTGFEYIKDADNMRCPAGHMSFRKARQGKKNAKVNQALTYYFDVNQCKVCPLREGCYKPGAKSKTYSVRIVSETHQKAINYQKSKMFSERAKLRGQIESKNAEMKHAHAMKKSKYVGLFGMQIQAMLTAIVVNAKRIIKLLEFKPA